MAKSTKFTAIDPNGVTHVRTSENRTYTHTVVYQNSKAAALVRVNSENNKAAWTRNAAFYFDCVRDGKHTSLANRFPHYANDTARQAKDVEEAKGYIGSAASVEEFVAAKIAEELAKVEATDWTKWHNAGWCGRHDLAVKLAAKYAGALILEAVTEGK